MQRFTFRSILGLALFLGAALAHATTVTFTTVGSTSWTPPAGVTSVSVLVVGGGGGGGSHIGGGGGGGGVVYNSSYAVTPGSAISITVGGGGGGGYGGASVGFGANAGGSGANSLFGTITAYGGGGGGGAYGSGSSGGSGGGGGGVGNSGASGVSGQGNSGGTYGGSPWRGGGGGGAGGAGSGGGAGSNGGAGVTYFSYTVGGGGGGGSDVGGTNPYSTGGSGGGGNGTWNGGNSVDIPGGAGTANSGGGGGGGGGGWCSGGSGGSGIVVISYTAAPSNAITWSGTWSTSSGNVALGFYGWPSSVAPGQTVAFSARVANSGSSTWGSDYSLELSDQGGNHLAYPTLSTTGPGAVKEVYFSVTAPSTAGVYTYYVTALQAGVSYFGTAQTLTLVVNRPPSTSLMVSTTTTAPGPVTLISTSTDADANLVSQAIDYAPPGGAWVQGTGALRWSGSATASNPLSFPMMLSTPGVWQFRARGADSMGAYSAFQTANVTVTNGTVPALTNVVTAAGHAGTPFSFSIVASNSPTFYDAVGLPSWLSINHSTGVLSGTPTAGGVVNLTLQATNSSGTGSGPLQIVITGLGSPQTVAFTSDGTFTVPAGISSVSVLVVGGGGGGGWHDGDGGGGGGGGGGVVYAGSYAVTPGQAIAVTVGSGGSAGYDTSGYPTNGGASTFGTVTAVGGGGGGNWGRDNGWDGASGGGGDDYDNSPGGSGATGQGYSGGQGNRDNYYAAGGGGGAGSAGGDANGSTGEGGTGGNGYSYNGVIYAAGGGGGTNAGEYGGQGGAGAGNGGVDGTDGTSALPNRGGGGGGSGNNAAAGAGGSGVVLVTYNPTITSLPLITSTPLTVPGTLGGVFGGYTVTASNNPTSFSATGLPPGLTLNSVSGVISGTPTAAGTYNVSLTATNATDTGPATTLVIPVTGASIQTVAVTASGSWTPPAGVTSVSVLVVGGGGGGGAHIGGGGGGGGVVYNNAYTVTPGSAISITIGGGGTGGYGGGSAGQSNPGNAGGNSVFGTITAYGGGRGGGAYSAGTSGGSGGGGGGVGNSGASGTSGQGNSGGSYGSGPWRGGGGGGAGGAGSSGGAGSNGGAGATYLGYTVGGGGGGGSDVGGVNPYSTGGSGGGGNGTWNGGNSVDIPGGAGTANTGGGGGGGGGGWCSGGNGGSGIVVISYGIGQGPTITVQPQPQYVSEGATATFTVTASGTPAPTYQWRKDGSPISGATNSSLVLTNVHVTDAGSYSAVVSNTAGTATSASALLAVSGTAAPTIAVQPAAATVEVGQSVALFVGATGNPTYLWLKDGVPVNGATGNIFTIDKASSGSAGSYTVFVSNALGSVTSNAAALTVVPAAVSATHSVVGSGYTAGSTVTITNTISFSGTIEALAWRVVLPAGWSYASSTSGASVTPASSTTQTLEWLWTSAPSSPFTFTYTLNVPAGAVAPEAIPAVLLLRRNEAVTYSYADPVPLVVSKTP